MSEVKESGIPGVLKIISESPGPRVIVMGGIHGDEPCGVSAVKRLEREFRAGQLQLAQGELLLITANHEAIEADQRSLVRNLNRLFKDNSGEPDCYEVRRAEQLKPLLAEAQYLLDLHSTTSPSPPFLMCEKEGLPIARQMGLDRVVLGWATLGAQALAGDTESWARSHGAIAFTLECGQHREPAAEGIAWRAALQFLSITGAIKAAEQVIAPAPLMLWLYATQLKESQDFVFSRTYTGFDALEEGELVGSDAAREYRTDRPGRIIFPVDPALVPMGNELYLLAEEYQSQGNQ